MLRIVIWDRVQFTFAMLKKTRQFSCLLLQFAIFKIIILATTASAHTNKYNQADTMRNNKELPVKVSERSINKYHDRSADSIPKIVFRTKKGTVDEILGASSGQKWNANKLWDLSTSSGLMFADNTITLENQVLVEDDAPGIGSIREDVWELLEPGVILRKYLTVEHWPLKGATLAMMVYPVLPVPIVEGPTGAGMVIWHGLINRHRKHRSTDILYDGNLICTESYSQLILAQW